MNPFTNYSNLVGKTVRINPNIDNKNINTMEEYVVTSVLNIENFTLVYFRSGFCVKVENVLL